MSEKFQNKYRIPSARAYWWDYSFEGFYFITICTAGRECSLGRVVNGELYLSEQGEIVKQCLITIPNQFSFAEIPHYIIMPNHIHVIVGISVETRFIASPKSPPTNQSPCFNASTKTNHETNLGSHETRFPNQETRLIASLRGTGGITGNNNPMLHDNISKIIRWFKGRSTFEIRKIHKEFAWQTRFYDHIIRTDEEYTNISYYISQNPINWEVDTLFKA